jgi:hypothetical protein
MMFFLILLIMFLGALGYAYVVTDKNANLTKENADLIQADKQKSGKLFLAEHYIEDIGSLLAVPGKYAGRQNMVAIYENASLDGMSGVMSPADVQAKMNAFGATIEIGATKGFEDMLAAVVNRVAALKKRITDLEAERDIVLTQKNETDAKFAEATQAHGRAAGEWRQTLDQANADFTSQRTQLGGQITLLQQNVNDRNTALAEEKEARAAERKQKDNEIGKLQMHNTALVDKDRMRHPPNVADGKVIVAKSGVATAFIDLGRKDMLQPGTIFQIKNRNESAIKGYATVTRVEQDRAEVLLHGVVDPIGDAVRDGDLLYNELYSPGAHSKRTIFLLGRFDYPYNKPQLEMLLKGLGNTVVGKMAPGVDTVILGDNPINEAGDDFAKVQDSDEYKFANNLGVEFVPMRKIRDIVKP